MGIGIDVVIEVSDIILVCGDLCSVVDVIWFFWKMFGMIKGNLFWVFVYNVVVILFVVFGLFNFMFVGVVMVFFSVFVVGNSFCFCFFWS